MLSFAVRGVPFIVAMAFAAFALPIAPAQAVVVSVVFDQLPPPGNDCAGLFGSSFNACTVTIDGQQLSPVIAKYDNDANDVTDTNTTLFPSIDGNEFTVNETNGTWSYTPGAGDPAIKYWVLKQGQGFTLFWEVLGNPEACIVDANSLACASLAIPIVSGSWTGEFSHITWYDTAVIPLPPALLLFGSALAGMGLLSRRRKAQAAA